MIWKWDSCFRCLCVLLLVADAVLGIALLGIVTLPWSAWIAPVVSLLVPPILVLLMLLVARLEVDEGQRHTTTGELALLLGQKRCGQLTRRVRRTRDSSARTEPRLQPVQTGVEITEAVDSGLDRLVQRKRCGVWTSQPPNFVSQEPPESRP
jgi:hypothetical protein